MNDPTHGREYWRSLRELASTPEFAARLDEEFPGYDPEHLQGLSRRSFMSIMTAAIGLAGLSLTGCRRWPEQQVCPHTSQPEDSTPGTAVHYATLWDLAGVATGLLVKSYDGRPIKVEGNPRHPDSLGAADAWAQASVLDVYDPDRSRAVLRQTVNGEKPRVHTWEEFMAFAGPHFAALRSRAGLGLCVVSEDASGPTFARLRAQFLAAFPRANWHTFEPMHRDHEFAGTAMVFGQPLRPQYDLARSKVIAAFDADLLGLHPAHQRHARGWAAGRASVERGEMNRLWSVEAGLSITGAAADRRLPVRASRVGVILAATARQLGCEVKAEAPTPEEASFAQELANDLTAARGASIVAVGASQPPEVHALSHILNALLGNHGRTITFTVEPDAALRGRSLDLLQHDLDAGKVDTLLILGGDPVYAGRLNFTVATGETSGRPPAAPSVRTAIHLSQDFNQTSARCEWHLPRAHYLECWGDGRAWDGTLGVQQPLILPLFAGKSPIELLAMLLSQADADGLSLVRETFRPLLGGMNFEAEWRRTLDEGVLSGSAWKPVNPEVLLSEPREISAGSTSRWEAVLTPDASVYDGRLANNGWLQEMPDPITQLVWDNAALLNKSDAEDMGIANGDVVAVTVGQATLEIAALIQPGVARGAVVLPLGYGRTTAGRVGRGVGFNTYVIRPVHQGYAAAIDKLVKTGRRYPLAMTQEHHLIDTIGASSRGERIGAPGRSGVIVHETTLERYRQDPHILQQEHGSIALPLFDPPHTFNKPHAWGMAIDLTRCIGCNACLVACQAENNVPIVGKQEVANHRQMHWLRVDRYYKGDAANPQTLAMPMACAQCENAPCEQVCPVAATVHDSEGLNTMVYNRCIGTRYCSNNCPYKVRRFNYFDWHARSPRTVGDTPPWLGLPDRQSDKQIDLIRRMVFNPDVTVRMRGVMEKCTYCVQRIQGARIAAELDHTAGKRPDERVRDGEVTPACAGACPTNAIVFGDLNDPTSAVAKLHAGPRAYGLLDAELGIKPRTKYLALVRNPIGGVADGSATSTTRDQP